MVNYLGILALSLIVLGFLGFLFLIFIKSVIWIREWKVRIMSEKLRSSGVKFRLNTDSNVIGICTEDDFQRALSDYMAKVATASIIPWEKVVLKVVPTFTFAGDEQTRRPIHVGVRHDLFAIGEMLVELVTNMGTSGLDPTDLENLIKIVTISDSRLFVPYAGKTKDPLADYSLYKWPNLQDAQKHLLGISI